MRRTQRLVASDGCASSSNAEEQHHPKSDDPNPKEDIETKGNTRGSQCGNGSEFI
jgi:hypothetical protein